MKNTLKIARAINDLTQEELAKAVGVTRQTILAIESGKYVPTTTLSLKLSKCLNTTVESLFILEETD